MQQNTTETLLTPEQLKACELLAEPKPRTTITSIANTVGVARSTIYRWLDDDNFRAYLDDLIDKYTDSELGRIWKALIKQCVNGDTQAIKLYFELKGKYKQDINLTANMGVTIIDDLPEDVGDG